MRRPPLALLSALAVAGLLVAGCSGDDDASGDADATTSEAQATATTAAAADVDCSAYLTVLELFGTTEQIATGGVDGQIAADEALGRALDALAPATGGDAELDDALATLGEVSFQVAATAEGSPAPGDVDASLDALEAAWADGCTPEADVPTTTAAPAPESSAPETTAPDGEGGSPDTTEAEAPIECPAPEVLEAEGYTCDSEGNLTPVG